MRAHRTSCSTAIFCSPISAIFFQLPSRRRWRPAGLGRRLPPRTSSRRPTPNSSRMPLNRGWRSLLQPKQTPRTMMLRQLPMQIRKKRARPQALTLTDSPASTRAFSPLPHHGGTATASTFALSPSSHALSAVVSHPTRIICATCSRAPSAARPAMSSPCRSAECTIVRCIARATSGHGGKRPASIQSRSRASCGRAPASMRGGSSPRARRKPPP
jgi:hypothetical protein